MQPSDRGFDTRSGLKKGKELNVYVLAIENDHGLSVSSHATQSLARRELMDYVEERWDSAIGDYSDEPMPEDTCDAIDFFFDDNETDHYTMQSTVVNGHVEQPPGDDEVDLDEVELTIVTDCLQEKIAAFEAIGLDTLAEDTGIALDVVESMYATMESAYNKLKD